jgi:UDP-N-acetylmuramoylalanine--D-glutamate ligase
VLIGADRAQIRAVLEAAGVPCMDAGSMQEAVASARSLAGVGDVVLLSPACASFDMFDSYEHRGEVFKAVVHELTSSR